MKIIVIGAGPAGLICSYKLSEKNHEVILFDKNEKVGKKIYVTGKGRCNVTNNCDYKTFFKNVPTNGRFLNQAYGSFTSQDTMKFFEDNGVPLIVERGNRVFPKSYEAKDIAETLGKVCKKTGVKIHLNEEVNDVEFINNKFTVTTNKNIYEADKLIIATGGKSYPLTGSTGDGYIFAKKLGHTIIPPVPALCALRIKEGIPNELVRFTLKNVTLKAITKNKTFEEFGEITFYKEGVAGATSFTISSLINRIDPKNIKIEIDLKPALSIKQLDDRFIRELQNKANKNLEDVLRKFLPKEIFLWFIKLNNINLSSDLTTFKKEERLKIINSIKSFKLTYIGLENIEHATVTSGGISINDINPKTLESKIIPGLYFAGEVIDVDAFTGGFSLQIAFSTGALVAKNIK